MEFNLTWLSWWNSSDWVLRTVFLTLLLASALSWAVIFYKSVQFSWISRQERRKNSFWEEHLRQMVAGSSGSRTHDRIAHALKERRVVLENGLALLASVGGTTPFIGLLGTVWGIMHALQQLGESDNLSMSLVAGPVAEALVATAVGLFAAIPAVLGYNFLIRRLRRLMVLLEGSGVRALDGEL